MSAPCPLVAALRAAYLKLASAIEVTETCCSKGGMCIEYGAALHREEQAREMVQRFEDQLSVLRNGRYRT